MTLVNLKCDLKLTSYTNRTSLTAAANNLKKRFNNCHRWSTLWRPYAPNRIVLDFWREPLKNPSTRTRQISKSSELTARLSSCPQNTMVKRTVAVICFRVLTYIDFNGTFLFLLPVSSLQFRRAPVPVKVNH